MLIYTKIAELQAFLTEKKEMGFIIGFVPTMGALHPGHISLIKASQSQCQLTVCSVFVNPTQFNDKGDLERYPRTPAKDSALLQESGCDILFMPDVSEIYPNGQETSTFNFGYLDSVMEGMHRPGHFNGVAQVVKRLFEIVKPDKAFFGAKDYQQVLIVKALVKHLAMPVQIISCPIMREADGLAMSSRNALLSREERQTAGQIPQIMKMARLMLANHSVEDVKHYVKDQVARMPESRLDYFEVCQAESLEPVTRANNKTGIILLIALFVGKIRLIDNL